MTPNNLLVTRRLLVDWLTAPLILLGFIVGWKLYVQAFDVSRFILPPPERVWTAFVELLQAKTTARHAGITLYESVAGFLWALAIGLGLGALLGKLPWLERALMPFVVALQVVPKVALVPLFILWFGFGPGSKVIVAAVLAFFPIFTNTLLGVKSVESGHRDVMDSLNAGRWQTFRLLELPSALPYVLAGMEVGIVLAVIGAVVGEYLGGSDGLGHLAVATLNAFQVDALFAVILLLTLMGFALYLVVVALRRLAIPWHESMAYRTPSQG
jgi:NitT/TauT family transport system permease protein